MAEIYQEGDLPEAGQQPGVSEKAQEQFKEKRKKAQAAIKKIHKEEAKKKIYDYTLSSIIVQMLNAGGFDEIIVCLSELIEKNVPSDFLLTILSLINKEAARYIYKQHSTDLIPRPLFNKEIIERNHDLFNQAIREEIKKWGDLIIKIAFKDIEKILETIIETETWTLNIHLPKLCALVLEKFLEEKKDKKEFAELIQFVEKFLNTLLAKLQESFDKKSLVVNN